MTRPDDLLATSRGRFAVGAAIAGLFVALRVALWLARQPFYDELFTVWIARKSFGEILAALRLDSGPPLYYFLVHLIPAPRAISFAASLVALLAMLRRRHFTAATLLALFPPAVLFAVDGRAYALCAMFVTIGVLALDDDREWVAAFAFVLAAYSHYYGLLFFPLLLRRPRSLVVTILALPTLWLALHQPKQAMGWVAAGHYPDALFTPIPRTLLIAGLLLTLAAAGRRWNIFALATIVPIAMAIAFTLAGRSVYVPLRFESVLAVPLLLWIGSAVEAWTLPVRRALVGAMALVFGIVTSFGIADHVRRPLDPYFEAVAHLPAGEGPVVATGYLYLETAITRPDAEAFPAAQALHPGWRAAPPAAALRAERDRLPPRFLWLGETSSPELAILFERYRVTPLFSNQAALVARMRRREDGVASP